MIPKFRVWLKKEKEMYPVYTLLFTPTGKLAQVVPVNTEEYKTNNYYWSDPESIKDVVLMQSTGVKDCNGKEIYEGDIVLWAIYELGDDDGSFEGKLIVDQNPYHLTRLYDANSLEVIGNIYESPELIKNKNIK